MSDLQQTGAPLEVLLRAILMEVIRANATFEVHQRETWEEVARTLPTVEGVSLAEGFGSLRALQLHEVSLSFGLEELRPGPFARLWRWMKRLPAESPCYRLSRAQPGTGALQLQLTLKRDGEGGFRGQYSSTEPSLQGELPLSAPKPLPDGPSDVRARLPP